MSVNRQPLVSFVTPFYNTESYLAECIESVLAQTYDNWEYLLVNNCSTDSSFAIAASYAERDPRIRLLDNDTFLSQVQNYNQALRRISPGSKYCKMVQADDWIFPPCAEEMVRVAENHPSAGIVGAYGICGKSITGRGLPYPSTFMSGKDICRWHLLNHPDYYAFGTPTSVLIRSDLIRNRDPFYDESSIIEDYEIWYEVLRENDFGFVHQVLTFLRVHDESLTGEIQNFYPYLLHAFICLNKYGRSYLTEEEFNERYRTISNRYFQALAKGLLYERNREFWAYHKKGWESFGYKVSKINLCSHVWNETVQLLCHPLSTSMRVLNVLHRACSKRPAVQ